MRADLNPDVRAPRESSAGDPAPPLPVDLRVRRFDPAKLAGAVVALFIGASVLGGCYTVLKHPTTEVTGHGDFAGRNCYSCHDGSGSALDYDPMHVPAFDYYTDSWYGFYAYPWWHRDIWHEDRYGYGGWRDSLGYQVPVDTGSRMNLWGRGTSAPPPLPPLLPGSPGGGHGGSAPPAEGGGTTTEDGKGPQKGRTMKRPVTPTPAEPPPTPPPATDETTTPPPAPAPAPAPGVTPPAPQPPPPAPPKDPKKAPKKDDGHVWGRGGH